MSEAARAQLLSPATVGDVNRSRVLQALCDHGPRSRADLARLAGVTRGTIGNIVQSLIDARVLEEQDPITGQVGKPARPLWFAERAGMSAVVSIDSGGCEAGLVNARGDLLAHEIRGFDAGRRSVRPLAREIVGALRAVSAGAEDELLGVGVAVPGTVDRDSLEVLGSGPVPALRGRWLAERLTDEFGIDPVLDNDSRVQALGEKWFGDGRGVASFASLQTGHGLGVGLVLDGVLLRGDGGRTGEFGHAAVVLDGERCVCGLRGCWETVATLRWLRREAAARGLAAARSLTAARLAERATEDATAEALLDEYADHLAIGIANLLQTLPLDRVILHGDAVGGGEALRERIEARVRDRVFDLNRDRVDVRLSRLEHRAELLGAAALVLSETYHLTA